jgi:hypothetical protein
LRCLPYSALSLIPDILIAAVIMKLTDDQWGTFWWALVFLFVLYSLLALKTLVWSSIIWRVWARRRSVERIKAALELSGLPKPQDEDSPAAALC